MDKEPIAKLIEHHRLDCMRMLHGQCSTRRCLVRGGWTPGDASGYSKATCEALETCRVLETLEAQLGGHALTAKEATANLLRASASEAAREAAEAKAARLEECVHAVQDATAAYLPPDGISAQECLNRILSAVDNPVINAVTLGAANGRP